MGQSEWAVEHCVVLRDNFSVMACFPTYPVRFEAFLGTEEWTSNILLQASWTLQFGRLAAIGRYASLTSYVGWHWFVTNRGVRCWKSHGKLALFEILGLPEPVLGTGFFFSFHFIGSLRSVRRFHGMKRLALNVALGQILSLCLTLTNTSTSLLWLYYNVNVPPLQNLLNYVMLFSVYTTVHIHKHGRDAWKLMIRERAWKCKIWTRNAIQSFKAVLILSLPCLKDILFAIADLQGQLVRSAVCLQLRSMNFFILTPLFSNQAIYLCSTLLEILQSYLPSFCFHGPFHALLYYRYYLQILVTLQCNTLVSPYAWQASLC